MNESKVPEVSPCVKRTFAAVELSSFDPPSHSTSFIFNGRATTNSFSFTLPLHSITSIQYDGVQVSRTVTNKIIIIIIIIIIRFVKRQNIKRLP